VELDVDGEVLVDTDASGLALVSLLEEEQPAAVIPRAAHRTRIRSMC